MNRRTAIELLQSDKPHERLKAARFFQEKAKVTDRELLENAMNEEDVLVIRQTYVDTVKSINSKSIESTKDTLKNELNITQISSDIYLKAVQETTGLLLHEFEPLIGVLRIYAENEIAEYDKSKTKKQIDRIDLLLEAISKLKRAASPSRVEEIELSEVIDDVINQAKTGQAIAIQKAGPAPLVVFGDRSLISIILTNAIRNAIESTEMLSPERRQPIVVNWNETDRDYWLAVIDDGVGLTAHTGHAFEIGTTTKEGHFGMGLPTAKQAALSLGGDATISPRAPQGARFEFRWRKSTLPAK